MTFRSSFGCWALFYKGGVCLSNPHTDSRQEGSYRLRLIANIVEGSPTRSVILQPTGKYLFLFQDLPRSSSWFEPILTTSHFHLSVIVGGRTVPYTRIHADGRVSCLECSCVTRLDLASGGWWSLTSAGSGQLGGQVKHGVPLSSFSTLAFAVDVQCKDLKGQRLVQKALVEEVVKLAAPPSVPQLQVRNFFLILSQQQLSNEQLPFL